MKFKTTAAMLLLFAWLLTGCGEHGAGTNTGTNSPSPSAPTNESTLAPTEEESLPSEPLFQAQGEINSKESETLILFAKWSAVSYNGKTADVTVKVGITCYSISTGKHVGSVTVNGEKKTFSTKAIENTTNVKKKFDFAELTFRVDLDDDGLTLMEIVADWEFEDTDGGISIDCFEASAIIKLPGGEVYVPDTGEKTTQEGNPVEAGYVGDRNEDAIQEPAL